jgi:mannosyl-3-phosphoglycerate phosphatase
LPVRILIFTDLDGSLLNHDDYDYAAAVPTLARIRAGNISLVIATSKTRREVQSLQAEMGIGGPFIVENGGGIFFHDSPGARRRWDGEKSGAYNVVRLGATYRDIRDFFVKMSLRYKIKGFGDMTIAEIAEMTGLSESEAERARQREFTEPFLAEDEQDIPEMERLARLEGFKITKGGRFYHLIGGGQDKGLAVKKCIEIYRRNETRSPWVTVGVGDSENDLPMLRQVDIPVLIPRPRKGWLNIELPGLVRAEETGSRGWNSAVGCVLDNLEEGYFSGKAFSCH